MTSLAAAVAELYERVEEAEARIRALEDNQETLFHAVGPFEVEEIFHNQGSVPHFVNSESGLPQGDICGIWASDDEDTYQDPPIENISDDECREIVSANWYLDPKEENSFKS